MSADCPDSSSPYSNPRGSLPPAPTLNLFPDDRHVKIGTRRVTASAAAEPAVYFTHSGVPKAYLPSKLGGENGESLFAVPRRNRGSVTMRNPDAKRCAESSTLQFGMLPMPSASLSGGLQLPMSGLSLGSQDTSSRLLGLPPLSNPFSPSSSSSTGLAHRPVLHDPFSSLSGSFTGLPDLPPLGESSRSGSGISSSIPNPWESSLFSSSRKG